MADLIAELVNLTDKFRHDDNLTGEESQALSRRIDAIHAEIAAAVRNAESWRHLLASVGAEQLVLASKKHGDALSILRDAERYRWLRERNALLSYEGKEPPFNFCVSDDQGDGEIHWVGSDLDSAVDTAMRAGEGEG